MDNLLWALGVAAVVYVLVVRPLQQAPRDAGGGAGDGPKLVGGIEGLPSLESLFSSGAPKPGGCGCGG